jgi:4-carboxymuconolactone decarboxylase
MSGTDAEVATGTDIEARHELILGRPPRIAPVQELSEEALAVTGRLRQIGSGRPAPKSASEVPEIVAMMLHHPQLYDKHISLSIELGTRGAIGMREREIAILRLGWLCQAPFEWGEHVKKAKAIGFTSEEIERIRQGSSASGWDEHERAIVRAVEELHAHAMISDETWEILARRFDERQLIELPILVGQYQTVAYSQNSLRVRLSPDNPGLTAG